MQYNLTTGPLALTRFHRLSGAGVRGWGAGTWLSPSGQGQGVTGTSLGVACAQEEAAEKRARSPWDTAALCHARLPLPCMGGREVRGPRRLFTGGVLPEGGGCGRVLVLRAGVAAGRGP